MHLFIDSHFSKSSNDILCIWNKKYKFKWYTLLQWQLTMRDHCKIYCKHCVSSLGCGRCWCNSKMRSPNTSYRLSSWVLLVLVKLLSGDYQRTHCWRVKVGSTNGLVSPGNRPLPETLLTGIYARPQWVNMYATTWKLWIVLIFFIPLTTCLDSRVYYILQQVSQTQVITTVFCGM